MTVSSVALPPHPAPPLSVCMATYNGAAHLREQVDSILAQLSDEDELVVVDDASSDETVAILETYRRPCIRVHRNTRNLGHVQSFSRALSLARRNLLVMADQDDVWLPGRLTAIHASLREQQAWVVSSNSRYVDSTLRPIHFDADRLSAADSTRHVYNIVGIFTGRRSYYGCAMALRREILPAVLPIPEFVESHDLWIAMAGNAARANLHLEEETLLRRIHGDNASVLRRPLRRKLWSRVVFLLSLVVLLARLARIPATDCLVPR